MLHPLPLSTLFPYTTLFRSRPETSAMHLVTDNGVFFEFVPFDPQFIASDGSVVQDAPVKRFSEVEEGEEYILDRKSTRLNSSHVAISYAVFCLKKKKNKKQD